MIQRVFTLTFNSSKNGCVAVCHNAAALLQHEKCLLMISSGDELFSKAMGNMMTPHGDFAPRGWDDGHREQNIYSLFKNYLLCEDIEYIIFPYDINLSAICFQHIKN